MPWTSIGISAQGVIGHGVFVGHRECFATIREDDHAPAPGHKLPRDARALEAFGVEVPGHGLLLLGLTGALQEADAAPVSVGGRCTKPPGPRRRSPVASWRYAALTRSPRPMAWSPGVTMPGE